MSPQSYWLVIKFRRRFAAPGEKAARGGRTRPPAWASGPAPSLRPRANRPSQWPRDARHETSCRGSRSYGRSSYQGPRGLSHVKRTLIFGTPWARHGLVMPFGEGPWPAVGLEAVPSPADGLDRRLAELAAEISHIHIDEVRLRVEVH